MRRLVVSLHNQAIELRYPVACENVISTLFGAVAPQALAPRAIVTIDVNTNGRYSIDVGSGPPLAGLDQAELCNQLIEEVVRLAATDLDSGVALHAGAVGWNGRCVLFPGMSGAGKSSLVAWFIDKGLSYLTDELCALDEAGGIVGFPRALVLKAGADELVAKFSSFRDAPTLRAGGNLMICPDRAMVAAPDAHPCGLIVFATYASGAALTIEPLSAAKAALKLMSCNVNARNLPDGGFGAISALAQSAPAVALRYGAFDQLEGLGDTLAKAVLDGDIGAARIRQFLSAFSGSTVAAATPAPERKFDIPAATPRRNKTKLTIGMATYDDYDGVYFSLQAMRLYHPEILDQTEFVVIDNHPDGACAQALKALEGSIPNYRYVPENTRTGTAVKNAIFTEAAGDFVLCMDCHVFVVPGAVKRLLDYVDRNVETSDLLQGPLLYDDLSKIATHFRPEWGGGMYGRWDDNGLAADPDAEPFDIPMQGMGLFACRRAAWPGFNLAFRGFGGEEGYIHEKFRKAGGRTLCLPFLRWVHRFGRPLGVPYRNRFEDRMWNYMVGHRELALPTDEVRAHFRELLGAETAERIFAEIEDELADR